MGFVMTSRQAAELDHALERNGWTAEEVKQLSSGDTLRALRAIVWGQAEIVPRSYPVWQTVTADDLSLSNYARIVRENNLHVDPVAGEYLKWLMGNSSPLEDGEVDFVLLTFEDLGYEQVEHRRTPTFEEIVDRAHILGLSLCDPRYAIPLVVSKELREDTRPSGLVVMSESFFVPSTGDERPRLLTLAYYKQGFVSAIAGHVRWTPHDRSRFIFRAQK